MSKFDAAPPNTHAGGNDDALRTKGSDPMTSPAEYADERVNMEEYERTVPRWKRVWQHSLTQMLLLSVQAFCGPAMADAIAGECFDSRPGSEANSIQGWVEEVSLLLRRPTLQRRSITPCWHCVALWAAPSSTSSVPSGRWSLALARSLSAVRHIIATASSEINGT